jgi:hypothetical protein
MMIEQRSCDPLLPPRLLANRVLAIAVFIGFMFMATFGSLLYRCQLRDNGSQQVVATNRSIFSGVNWCENRSRVIEALILVHS